MQLLQVLKKVREGCEMHMNQLDNDGYCAESDEYVVALAFLEDHIEDLEARQNFGDKVEKMVRDTHAHTAWEKNRKKKT